jgi:hypothetical protein
MKEIIPGYFDLLADTRKFVYCKKQTLYHEGFEALKAMATKCSIFWGYNAV